MRVIAGQLRGHLLSAPQGDATRPTADRLKENLFNLLSPYLRGAHFLDLFSGSGAIAIEALSRGAAAAVLVENAAAALTAIRQNIAKTRLENRAQVLPLTAAQAIARLENAGRVFNLVFLDPPYYSDFAAETLTLLARSPLLAKEARVVAELPREVSPPVSLPGLAVSQVRAYGRVQFAFYEGAER